MNKGKTILVADRNPHIRQLIKRELGTCGYQFQLVRNGKELLRALYGQPPVHLLILDPGFPGMEAKDTVRKIVDRIPQLPVVLYRFGGADIQRTFAAEDVFYVDKNGSSIETLKSTVNDILSSSSAADPLD